MGVPKLHESGIKKLADQEVVKRVMAGEKELFEILMRRHNQKLYRIIRGYIIQEEEVLDVMQETYLKAFYKLDGFRLDAEFSTWLIRIGINEALQWLRKNKRIIHMEDAKISQLHESQRAGIDHASPESRLINNELNLLLTKSIDRIPETYRVVFIMSEVEQMSQAEIATALDISVSNVKVRLHRAKKLIKEELFSHSNAASVLEFGSRRCDQLVDDVMKMIL
ncbi:MAG: RNA polymerase sigma factor [Cytophaga sp.]|uniref:RNA polymerase sigma factor n=1 Tax=Cytophaga sp. TaxID=29535 RepID=UPI003F7F2709